MNDIEILDWFRASFPDVEMWAVGLQLTEDDALGEPFTATLRVDRCTDEDLAVALVNVRDLYKSWVARGKPTFKVPV